MLDDKDALPSDREDGGLKPRDRQDAADRKPASPPTDDKRTEADPSEQPS